MEGEVVAVVQALHGLAVSLLTEELPILLTETPIAPPPRQARVEPRASQTHSDHGVLQICNEPYVSTYQVAHCGAKTWSPTRCIPEFPPQRLTPSPTQGNFEVGNGINRSLSPAHYSQNCREGIRIDGGHLPRQRDRDVDAFVSSLRKYPERTPSAELLERLLNHMHLPKDVQSIKPLSKGLDNLEKHVPNKEPKNQSTQKKDRSRSPLKISHQFDTRHVKTQGLDKSLPNVADSNFDYLNSGVPWPPVDRPRRSKVPWLPGDRPRRSENRSPRNSFREMYQEDRGPAATQRPTTTAFPMCPTMQRRYERHVNQYHPTTSKAVETINLKICSKCFKRPPCSCGTRTRRADQEEEEKRAIEDAIFTWLKEIPVYQNECPKAKFIRDAMVKELAEKLSSINNEEFNTKTREEIKKALDKLPMWHPRDEKERDCFRNAITDSLLEKIKDIKDRKKTQEAVATFFDTIHFDNSANINKEQVLDDITKELNKLSLNRPEDEDVYRDLLKIKAFELLDRLPIKFKGNKYEYLNKLCDELVYRLTNVAANRIDPENKQILNEGISDILVEMDAPIKDRQKIEERLRDVATDVVEQGMDLDKAKTYIQSILEGKVPDSKIKETTEKVLAFVEESQKVNQMDPETTQIVKADIGDILDASDIHIKNRDKIEESLQKAVTDIVMKDMDKEKAVNHIKSALKGKVPEGKVEDIVTEVLALADHVGSSQAKKIDQETKQIIKEDISDILDLSNSHIKNRGKVEESLQKIVGDIVTKGMDNDKAVSHIKNILKGKVPDDKVEDIVNKVITLSEHVTPSQTKKIDQETKQIIKEDISDILDLTNSNIKNRGKVEESLQKAVTDIIAKNEDADKAMTRIKTVLKGKVSEDKVDDIAKQVLILAEQVMPTTIDQSTKQNIKEDISDILDLSNSYIKNRGNVEKGLQKVVADIVTKDMDKGKAASHIKSILKGKVSEDKVEDIINEVLTLADHVTPSQTNKIDQETKQIIKEDISDILNSSDVPIKNRDKVEKSLQKAVTEIVTKDMDKDRAASHIKSILKGKVSEDKVEDIINEVLTLADHVTPSQTKKIDQETKQIIKEDISDILNSSDVPIKNRDKVEKSLQKAVTEIVTKDMDKDRAASHIKSILKGKVSEDKVEDIINEVLTLADHVTPSQTKKIDQETKQIIKEDISDILNSSDVPIKNRDKVEKSLHKAVTEIVTKDMDKDKAVSYIKSVLKGKVSEDKVENIVTEVLKLADHITPSQTKKMDQETKQIIKEDISDILDLSNSNIKNRGKLEESLQRAVADIVTKDMDKDKAAAHIKSILKGKVSEDKVQDLVKEVLTLADNITPSQTNKVDQETKQIIKEDISDILDLSNSNIKNRGKVEESLQKAVTDIITKNEDAEKAVTRIKNALKGKVSEDKIDDIAKQVLTLANQNNPAQIKTVDQKSKKIIKEDIRNILDLSNAPIKNRTKVEESLQKAVSNIISKNISEEQAESQIKTILKGKVSDDKIEDITKEVLTLVNQGTPTQLKFIDQQAKQIIKEDISDILDSSDTHIKNRDKVEENLHKAIADIVTKDMDKDDAIIHIKSVLKGNVSPDKLDSIAEHVLTISEQVRPKTIEQEAKEILKGDINDILDLSNAHVKDRGKVEDNLHNAVIDIVTKNKNKDDAINQIKSVLKGKVSRDKVDDIAKQILTLADQVTPIEAIRLDHETKKVIKDDISDILDTSNVNIKNRNKVEKKLEDAVSNIITNDMDKDKAITYIKAVLKGKVPKDNVDDIAKQVLALADQVKLTTGPKITETLKTKSDVLNGMDEDKTKRSIKSVLKRNISEDVANQREASQSTLDPRLQETIKEDLNYILDHTNGRITNRGEVEESLRDVLNDLVMRGIDKDKAQDYIHTILKGNVSDTEAEDISRKILELAEEITPSFNKYSGGPSASSTQNAEKLYFDQVYEAIRDWLRNHVSGRLNEKNLHKVTEAIANDVVDRQKYLQLNPRAKTTEEKELEILKERIYKELHKLIDMKTVLSVLPEVKNLMHDLKTIPLSLDRALAQDSVEFIQENLEGALLDWLRDSPIYHNKNSKITQTQEQMIIKLAESLATALTSHIKEKPGKNADGVLLKEITKHLKKLPLEPQFKSEEYIRMLSKHMLEYLKSLQLFQDISVRTELKDSQNITSFIPSTNQLTNVVKNWCETLPLSETEEEFQIKEDLANKIILKVTELNMNQDIFNDDLLYEEMLLDFIDLQVKALQIDLNVTEASKNLIDELKKIKQKVKDSLIGREYKQNLRDTISITLPPISCPTTEDLASFELMKDKLADAFINLQYSGEDDALRAKFKRRITEEVNKFVNDYLRCCPATPLSARKLNENLYNALKNVPVPSDESMRSEVEVVRLKNVVNDWLKTQPMYTQSKSEQLHTNKIITLMSQRLQQLENERSSNFEEIAEEEIVKYLRKLPLKNKDNLDKAAKVLIDKLINTSESRTLIEGTSSLMGKSCMCEKQLLRERHCTGISSCASYLSFDSLIPPCGLSNEDKKIMQRIRERSQLCHTGTQSKNKQCCKDAALNPPPSNNESQTEMMPRQNKSCQYAEKVDPVCSKPTCPKANRTSAPCPPSNQADLAPYVLVKEYYWNSTLGEKIDSPCQTPVPSGGRCLPSPLISSQQICPPQRCLSPGPCDMQRRICQRPRSYRECPSLRKPPRRQVSSACPNEYITRPKPHNCLQSRTVIPPERSCPKNRCRRIETTCRRKTCLSCQNNTSCSKCYGIEVPCPHPTSLYFK